MSIKKNICKIVGESLLPKDLYEYKMSIKEEIEKIYKDEIESLKDALKIKQKQIDDLILVAKESIEEPKTEVQPFYSRIERDRKDFKNKFENKEYKEESRFPYPVEIYNVN